MQAKRRLVFDFNPLEKKLAGKGEIQTSIISSGTVETCLYTGPYDKISPAHRELNKLGALAAAGLARLSAGRRGC